MRDEGERRASTHSWSSERRGGERDDEDDRGELETEHCEDWRMGDGTAEGGGYLYGLREERLRERAEELWFITGLPIGRQIIKFTDFKPALDYPHATFFLTTRCFGPSFPRSCA